jgi:hypothetical protein
LAEPVVGQELRLPARDAFGRELPEGALRVVTLPCGGCMDLAGYLASASAGRPVVFASADPDAAASLAEVGRATGAYLVLDPEGAVFPRTVLDYPPVALTVGPDRRILAQESDPARVAAFLGLSPTADGPATLEAGG